MRVIAKARCKVRAQRDLNIPHVCVRKIDHQFFLVILTFCWRLHSSWPQAFAPLAVFCSLNLDNWPFSPVHRYSYSFSMSTMPLNLNDGHDLSVSMIPHCFNDCTLRPFTSLRHWMRRPTNAPSSALPLPHQHLPLLAGAHFCLLLLRPCFQHLPLARLHTGSCNCSPSACTTNSMMRYWFRPAFMTSIQRFFTDTRRGLLKFPLFAARNHNASGKQLASPGIRIRGIITSDF